MIDYYILCNQILLKVQSLRKQYEKVFELSLNSSLLTGKIDKSHHKCKTFETMAKKIGAVSKYLDEELSHLLIRSNKLNTISLENNKFMVQVRSLRQTFPMIKGSSNQACVEEAVQRVYKKTTDCSLSADQEVYQIHHIIKKLELLNDKLWLILTNLKIEIGDDSNLQDFHLITHELETIHQSIEQISIDINLHIAKIKNVISSILKNEDDSHQVFGDSSYGL